MKPSPENISRHHRGGKPARPPLRLFTSTLWEYPSQHYDPANTIPPSPALKGASGPVRGSPSRPMQGDKAYIGATPSWVIWQLLTRYTREKDLIVDPMCGSGTTIDVARDLNRRVLGYDLAPSRPDIFRADGRKLPLENEKADFVFLDPPYSTHVDYSDDPACIGKLDASSPAPEPLPPSPPRFAGETALRGGLREGLGGVGVGSSPAASSPLNPYYSAMSQVISECHRILKNRRYFGLYVSDSFKKGKGPASDRFMPIGFDLFSLLREHFQPIDIITVVRHNQKLTRGNWHKAADEGNFFLRGFNYLFIMKKEA